MSGVDERMSEEHRIASPVITPEEIHFDASLRPTRFEEFIGQEKVKENLRIFVQAARDRKEALDHVLLVGPPGLGKTTLSHILARELGVEVKVTSGPVLERPGDLAAILTNLNPRDILFVDEIHRMNRVVEEVLYPAMEEFQLDILIGQGPSARSIRIDLPRFTLVGATTRSGMLTSPLRDRFGIFVRLDYYGAEDIARVVRRSASILNVGLADGGDEEIARRARGTPRIANRLLRRVRDYAQVRGDGTITREAACEGLALLEVDERGLDPMDRKLLLAIIDKFDGGPVGIDTLSAALSEDKETLEDVYEPFLIQEGLLDRTPRGRVATRRTFEYFGRPVPEKRQNGSAGGEQGRLL